MEGCQATHRPTTFNVARIVLDKGVAIDEVIVFMDNSEVQYEAAYYRDIDAFGAVTAIERDTRPVTSWYVRWRRAVISHFLVLPNLPLFDRAQRFLGAPGYLSSSGDDFG